MLTPKTFLSRYSSLFKAAFVFILALLLMIPNKMIHDIIREREWKQHEAIDDISNTWGKAQTLAGPMLSIPYYKHIKVRDTDGRLTTQKVKKHLRVLPDNLIINGDVFPEKRYRGIYEVVVYNSDLNIKGDFNELYLKTADVPINQIQFDEAFLSFGINDLRGLQEQVRLTWNGKEHTFSPGTESSNGIPSGLSVPLKLKVDSTGKTSNHFAFNMKLKGSQSLNFTPTGKATNVNISSSWQDPSFYGDFLPDTRTINEDGFHANWKILNVNRNYPQAWNEKEFNIYNSSFGVGLILPVDNYQKSTRAIKYAFLFICLTFLAFYFIEVMKKVHIHPIQYILVGLALCIFYTLLVSISEQLHFNLAYLIASTMTIGLIYFYAKSILKRSSFAFIIGGILTLLYGFIFTIIQLQDFSLLVGSLGLFFILAFIMLYSRKIDWYNIKK